MATVSRLAKRPRSDNSIRPGRRMSGRGCGIRVARGFALGAVTISAMAAAYVGLDKPQVAHASVLTRTTQQIGSWRVRSRLQWYAWYAVSPPFRTVSLARLRCLASKPVVYIRWIQFMSAHDCDLR
jgi:hypothetical protein